MTHVREGHEGGEEGFWFSVIISYLYVVGLQFYTATLALQFSNY